MNERRTLQQIYYDLLSSLMKEHQDKVSVTRVQGRSNLAYDKTMEHLNKMVEHNLITEKYTITNKGYSFHSEYEHIIDQVNKLANIMDLDISPPTATSRNITAEMVNKITQMNSILKEFEEMCSDWVKAQEDNK